MTKREFEKYLFTVQVLINWLAFENRLSNLNFYDGTRFFKSEESGDTVGCFAIGKRLKYYYNFNYFIWLAKNHSRDFVDDVIDFVHHEMTHYYCYLEKIADTNAEYHTKAFKYAIEKCGGVCEFYDTELGWEETRLKPETKDEIKHIMKHLKGKVKRQKNES